MGHKLSAQMSFGYTQGPRRRRDGEREWHMRTEAIKQDKHNTGRWLHLVCPRVHLYRDYVNKATQATINCGSAPEETDGSKGGFPLGLQCNQF